MIRLFPTTGAHFGRPLRAGVLVLVCALGGAVDVLNNSFASLVARMASFPEEEEHGTKDRTALIAAAQPPRKGSVRPGGSPGDRVSARPSSGWSAVSARSQSQF